MQTRSIRFIVFVFLTSAILAGQICEGQIRKVNRIFQRDIGVATVDRRGNPVISFNPRMQRQYGPHVSEFFMHHEYAHHRLNHFRRNISVQQAEAEADCYATRHSSPAAVRSAIQLFNAGLGSSRQHGSSYQRSNRVSSCAIKRAMMAQSRATRVIR